MRRLVAVAMSCAFCAVAEAQVPATLQPFVKVDAPVLWLMPWASGWQSSEAASRCWW